MTAADAWVDLFLCGVGVGVVVACASLDEDWAPSEGLECDGVFAPGSRSSGSSGRSGSPTSAGDAVCELSAGFVETSGVVSRYSRAAH